MILLTEEIIESSDSVLSPPGDRCVLGVCPSCGFLGCLVAFENRTMTIIVPRMLVDSYTTRRDEPMPPMPDSPDSDDVSERLTGIRSVLSMPHAYRIFQAAVGANRVRKILASEILAVREGERVLDIGCGTADILREFPPVDYLGVDHSAKYIDHARARFGDRGTFVNARSDELAATRDRTLVMMIGVLHHLADDEALIALEFARAALVSTGRLVTIDPTISPGQHPIARFLAQQDRGNFVRTPEEGSSLVREVFPTATVTVRHDLLRIPYSHLVIQA